MPKETKAKSLKSAFRLAVVGSLLSLAGQGAEELRLSADFGSEEGKIRPALHSSGFGPTICSQTEQDLADVKAMGFDYARTHDWALINPNERVCDYFHIFPLMQTVTSGASSTGMSGTSLMDTTTCGAR